MFTPNESSSWSIHQLANGGLFELNTVEESLLGLSGNAYYGFDNIDLGLPGSGLPQLKQQLVAGIAENTFWLGSVGLSPWSTNFSSFNHRVPSLLSTLRDEGHIPSVS